MLVALGAEHQTKRETTVRTLQLIAIVLVAVATGLGSWYYLSRPSSDKLGDTLKSLGYLPINPPSNLMNLGSLYYVL